jgi:hypothetical protein
MLACGRTEEGDGRRADHRQRGEVMSPTNDQIVMEPTAAPEVIGGYQIHPAARQIQKPTPTEYDRLKKDISEHGVRIPVVMTDDGRILDGRSRVQACTELGIKYPIRPATPDEMLDPVAASRSLNVHRRHLSTDQIDQILATYITDNAPKIEADRQAAKAAQRAGLKQGTARGVEGHLTGKTSAKIAKDTGMPEDAVKRVLKVQKDAPEKLADVAAGKLSAAKVLKESKPPANKTDLWEGIIRYETPKERRDVVKWLDKAFEFLSTWTVKPPAGFDSFGSALAAIEMDAMCLTPAHIKALTGWHDRIAAILQKAEVKPEPASVPAWAEEVAP